MISGYPMRAKTARCQIRVLQKIYIFIMKNVFLFLFLLGFILSGYSQQKFVERCLVKNTIQPYKITDKGGIDDFTITDSEGITWNLYEQLDLGKTVFLDLFETG